ncbi:MAG TPA: LysR family transcriptional regulator [Candidatus Sulfotelmatobacter sp.]|jgi:DNA-binding transcriptional LysR family regulator|nr:LysR family transcriptional regulator [Candidatus Sulfotelmatobacter sp.]
MDRLDSMVAFVRVAESHSFSEAARRLNLSKSVVSRQVSGLEADLGARLFHRTTRSLTLTEVGAAYLERCQRILTDIEEANLSVSNLQAAPRGKLRVSAPVPFALQHLAPALPDFLSRYPEMEIDLALNDRFVNLVEEGFDLAIRIGKLDDSSLIARYLAPARRVVVGSPEYLAARGTPQTPDDLSNHCCLTYSNLSAADEWSFVTPEGKRWPVEVKGRLRVNNGDVLRQAALGGLGLTLLPTFIVGADLQAGTLVQVLQDFVAQNTGIHAVYPHARHLSPKVRAFVDFLAERFGPRPYWDLVI